MVKTNVKSVFVCSDCGNETTKWFGKCNACGSWNSIFEQKIETDNTSLLSKQPRTYSSMLNDIAIPITKIENSDDCRILTGCAEFDRVLGGGLVKGSVVLLSGEPGIGKSTLLLQICSDISKEYKVLYVSGEESKNQLKVRAKRLNVSSDNLYILTETNISDVLPQTTRSCK